MLARLLVHSSHYSIGTLLVTLASFVSFPILTRTFTVAEYGALSLLGVLLLFWTCLGKLGLQQSIPRFLAEARAGRRPITEPAFLATVLLGMGATGLAVSLLAAAIALLAPASWLADETAAAIAAPISAIVLLRVLDSAVSNILRAQQRSVLLNAYLVLRKYASLALILLLVLHFVPGLRGFFLATFVVEALALAAVIAVIARADAIDVRGFSPGTFRAMLLFGMPLIALELSGIVLNLGDRYVIQAVAGSEPLGHYSAAYNLCEYVQMVILTAFSQAVMPIYVRMWEEQGEEPTRRFLERSVRLYFMVAAPVVAGMYAVGHSVLGIMASDKYLEGAIVIPWVMAGMVIDGGAAVFSAGMYIHKQNRRIVPWVVVAAVANVLLNLAFVPRYGILAAGVSTLLCYVVVAAAAWRIGARYLYIAFPWRDVLKYAALAAVMALVVTQIHVPSRVLELVLRIVAGVAVYAGLLLALDRQAREGLGLLRARLMPAGAR